MRHHVALLLLLVIQSSCAQECQDGAECRPSPGSAHECEHYNCNMGVCEFGFDGGPVTCGNTDCAGPGDCHDSTPNMSISCVSGQCVGTTIITVASCPGPGVGPATGNKGSNEPCALTEECAAGLSCNYAANQSAAPFGIGCGLCQSGPVCPPVAPFWANCSGCPPYISRGVAGDGCTWPQDCAPSLTCVYPPAAVAPSGFCGQCG